MFEPFDLSKFPGLQASVAKLVAQGIPEDQVADRIWRGMYVGADKASDLLLRGLKRRTKEMLADRKLLGEKFRTSMRNIWGRGFDALRALLEAARETGEEFYRYYRGSASAENDLVFEALVRLQARACLKTSEILWLMEGGYASGAMARWRPLHELAVVAFFISDNGPEIAERYLLHVHVENHKEALQYQVHCKRLGKRPIRKTEMDKLKQNRDAVCGRFGPDYATDWGWAGMAVGSKHPRFTDIENRVDLNHFRPYFKISSYFTHAGSKGLFFNPGTVPLVGEPEIMLAGPSNAGLYEPGARAALSLSQVTTVLLAHNVKSIFAMVVALAIQELAHEAEHALLKAEQKLIDGIAKVYSSGKDQSHSTAPRKGNLARAARKTR